MVLVHRRALSGDEQDDPYREGEKNKSPYALGRIRLFIRDKHVTTVGKTQKFQRREGRGRQHTGGNVKERSPRKYHFTWAILSHVIQGEI